MAEPEITVTLVHGTFVQNAPWCKPTSPLCSAFASAFGDRCLTSDFPWSGRNAHTARLEAGEALREQLMQLTQRHPSSAHFLIAHSHGGNVASYALRSEELQKRIRGIVFLATPHMRCRPRDLNKTLDFFTFFLLPISAILAATVSTVIAAICIAILGYQTESLPETAWWIATILYLSFFGILCWAINRRIEAALRPRLESVLLRRQEETIKQYDPPFLAQPRVFGVSTPLDEAGIHLRFVRFIGGIPFALWRPGLLLGLCVVLEVLIVLSLLFFALPETIAELPDLSLHGLGITAITGRFFGLSIVPAVPFLLFGMIALIPHLFMLLLPKIIRSPFYGFGGETVWDNLLVDIKTIDRPYAAQVEDLRRFISRVSFKRHDKATLFPRWRLGHCSVYDDQDVIQKIVEWIMSTPEPRVRPPRPRSPLHPLGL